MEEAVEYEVVVVEDTEPDELPPRVGCRALTTKGEPCRSWALLGEEYCYNHHPNNTQAAAEARARGGANSRAKHNHFINPGHIPTNIRTVEDILQLLDYSLAEFMMLNNSLSRNKGLVQLAGMYAEILREGEVQDRIDLIEEEVNSIRKLATKSPRW